MTTDTTAPLTGITVLDCATLFAGPLAATILGDYGADVVKVEHPRIPDPSRTHGRAVDGIGLWWKMLGRNKNAVTLDLSQAAGAALLLRLVEQADVLIENFRPGTLERWGVGPEVLLAANPRLIIARVTGFGQFGPYSDRAGFGTLAESMSGFAAMTGEPDGPPTLPPFGLADGVAALCCVSAIMMALYHRDTRHAPGQIVDLAIIEPLVTLLGPQPTVYGLTGEIQPRTGNRSVNNAPRNTYLTADGKWVAVSTSTQSVADRVLRMVGQPQVVSEEWFQSGAGRAAHADLLDSFLAPWIESRSAEQVMAAFTESHAAIAPIYDVADLMSDPQYTALDTVTTVDDDDFGTLRMQNVLFRLSLTPGAIRHTGRRHGADTDELLRTRLELSHETIDGLRAAGVV